MKVNQTTAVRNYLEKKGHITSWEAIMKFGCTRLSAKIFLFRKEGLNIVTERVTKKNRYGYTVSYANYKLVKQNGKSKRNK